MVVFGLILLLVALAVIAYMWLATAGMDPVSIDYGFLNVELSPLWLFFAGGITLAVATSGLWLMGVGARSGARRAREMRELRKQAKEADRRSERDRDRAALGTSDDRSTSPRGGHSGGRGTGAGAGYGDRGHGRGRGDDGPILPRPGAQERQTGSTGTTGTTGTAGPGSTAPGSSTARPPGTDGTHGRDSSLDIDR